jgi:hypothetical protein
VLELLGATLVLVATAGLAAAALRLTQATAYALAVYLLAWAEIVLLGEALSLAGAANAVGYALGEAVLLVAALVAWQLRGRPLPPRPALRPLAFRAHPLLLALAVAVGAALVYQAFLVVASPPNNFDSMTYHLSRVAAWYHDGGIHYLDAHTSRQNLLPPNSELAILYTFVFLGRDLLAAAPQLLAELAVLAAVYGCARRLLFPRSAALFAALTTATLTEFALQSVTTQNDLVAAAFVAAAAYFLLGRSRTELPLVGLAFALAVGTKTTAVFAAPALALVAFALLPRRWMLELAAWSAAAFLAVGSFGYALNLRETGHLLPSGPEFAGISPTITLRGTISTSARVLFRFIDLSGYHVDYPILKTISLRGEDLFNVLHIDANPPESTSHGFTFYPNTWPNEDRSFFGILGLFLVLPLAFGYAGALALRKTSAARGLLGLALPIYVVTLALGYSYNAWIGRFMLIPVALVMPLAARLYSMRLLAGLATVVGIATLGVAHAYNVTKPTGLNGGRPVWTMPRAEAQGLGMPMLDVSLATLDRHVPANARLAVVLGGNEWDYPLYGERLGRRLSEFPTVASATRSDAHWLVLGLGFVAPQSTKWRAQPLANGWTLLSRDTPRTIAATSGD